MCNQCDVLNCKLLEDLRAQLSEKDTFYREKLATFITGQAFATGHGESFGDLLEELAEQIKEIRSSRDEKEAYINSEAERVYDLRQEMKGLEDRIKNDTDYKEMRDYAKKLEHELSTLKESLRWRKVEDGLPLEGDICEIAWQIREGANIERFVGIYEASEAGWHVGYIFYEAEDECVIGWRPLTPGPEGGEE